MNSTCSGGTIDELAAAAGRDEVGGEGALRIERRVRLRDDVLLLFERREVADRAR